MFKAIWFLSAALVAAPLAAQEAPAGDPSLDQAVEDALAGDPAAPLPETVVVTATRAAQPIDEVGRAVTVIDRAEIERRQVVSVADILATTPGVTVTRNGSAGGFTGVRLRGAEAEQTLVVIDGVRVNDPSSPGGGFDFANLLSASVDRVEVLRGPNSVPWGSQAIGGVVNVITRRPAPGVQASARAEYGYADTVYADAGLSGSNGIVSAALTGGYLRSDGVSSAADGSERDGYRQYGGSGRLNVEITPAISVDLRGYFANSRTEIDGFPSPDFELADTTEFSETQELYGYAGVNIDLLDNRLLNRLAFTIADVNRENFDPASGPDPVFFGRGRSERYEYQADFRPVDAVRVVAGAEREDSRFDDGSTARDTGITSVYGQLIVRPVERLTLTGGIRHDDHDAFGTQTTFGADAALALAIGTTIRASYGEGFKAPTLFQLYGAGLGNDDLEAETARNVDVGVSQSALGGRARVSATYFNRRTRNQIGFISCPAASVTDPDSICFQRRFGTYDNIARTNGEGVELELALRPIDRLTVTGQYSYIETENRSAGADFGNDLARRPRQTVAVNADYRLPFGLNVGGTLLHVGDSFDDPGNTVRLDGYVVASVRAELPIAERFAIYGRIDNLFDERYQTVAGYGVFGRAAYGGVRLRFP